MIESKNYYCPFNFLRFLSTELMATFFKALKNRPLPACAGLRSFEVTPIGLWLWGEGNGARSAPFPSPQVNPWTGSFRPKNAAKQVLPGEIYSLMSFRFADWRREILFQITLKLYFNRTVVKTKILIRKPKV